ncbi:MAG: zinc ribbon domain-containing protein [Thermoplasmata archaeon]
MAASTPPPPPPPPSSSPPGPTVCPKCGTAATPGSRFCNSCGSSLYTDSGSSTGTQAPPGAPPVDIRQTVDGSRGALKRLQLLIPGFRGYRQGEDIREADSFLRIQVSDKLKNARATCENSRQALTSANQFATLTALNPIIADLMGLEGRIRHAEQGYSGISPAIRVNPQQLDRLYEYDYGFVEAADQLNETISPLPSLAMASNAAGVQSLIATARGQISELDQAFKARMQVIEGIRVS